MKKLSKNFQLILLSSAVLFLIFSLFLNQNSLIKYSWEVKSINNNQYEIYVKGKSLEKLTVVDIRFLPSQNNQIVKVESGGFFVTPIIDSINAQQNAYLIIKNPGNKTPVDTTKPILSIIVDDSSPLNVLPTSQIYLSKKGVFYPSVD